MPNTNPDTVLDVANINAHFTSLSAAAIAYIQSIVSVGSPLVLTANNQNEVPLTIEAYAGQIQPLLIVEDQNGNAGFQIDENCGVIIESQAAAEVPLIVRGAALQSANSIEVRDSSDNVTFAVKSGVGSSYMVDIPARAENDQKGLGVFSDEGGGNAPIQIYTATHGKHLTLGHGSGFAEITANDSGVYIQTSGSSGTREIRFRAGNAVDAATLDSTTTAGQTRLLVYDVDNGQLERVTVGAADSGGVGFKVLRIPN